MSEANVTSPGMLQLQTRATVRFGIDVLRKSMGLWCGSRAAFRHGLPEHKARARLASF